VLIISSLSWWTGSLSAHNCWRFVCKSILQMLITHNSNYSAGMKRAALLLFSLFLIIRPRP
jgi:hypothetical protein